MTNFVKQVKWKLCEMNTKSPRQPAIKNQFKKTQATCNALVESQLPAIIDGLLNFYKKPLFSVMIVITIIQNNDNFQVWSTTTSTRRRFVQTSLPVHKQTNKDGTIISSMTEIQQQHPLSPPTNKKKQRPSNNLDGLNRF